ncbi:hypothetical protein C8R44DRAFT_984838 [Mycena epipterygia]|nr:hypothetical protein C8R44DRAFT_984838 [Mycena epipterygia]
MDSNSGGQDSETPTRVDDLWFATDMIVIRAVNKIFRVSGAILAARSTVFRDMITFPQPTSGDTEEIDGCPVVLLHDPARDVEVFLRAIYDSSYFMPAPAPIELWIVLAILRLSHKYDVRYLHRRALHHLAENGSYTATPDQNPGDHLGHLIVSESGPVDNLSVVTTAVQVGALWLLPWPYYWASGFLPEQLHPFLEGAMEQHARKCLAAHKHLIRGTVAINRFLVKGSPDCATREICDDLRGSILLRVFDHIQDESDLDPLFYWSAESWEKFSVLGLCAVCCTLAKTGHDEAASAFRDKLPSIFGLPPWEDLRAMQRDAMGEETDGMPNFNVVGGVVAVFAFLAHARAQEEVTLWQFGQGRLLSAALTLPLEPLGTASDGSATTYLYQALNPATITTVNAAGIITTQTTASATPRTIAASASGWFEGFGLTATGNISCNLINSDFGACLEGTVTANTGVPTPEALQVSIPASSSTSSTVTPPPIGPTSAPNSNPPDQTSKKQSRPTGAIVGGVLGGCAILGITLTLFMFLRRRRLRRTQEASTAANPYFISPEPHSDNLAAALQVQTTATTTTTTAAAPPIVGPRKNRAGIQPWPGRPSTIRTEGGSSSSELGSESLIQPSMTEIVDRLRRLEGRASIYGEDPPPNYVDGSTV